MKKTPAKILRVQGLILFAVYLALLVHFLFFSEMTGRVRGGAMRYNLTPFLEIRRFWHNREVLGTWAVLLNLAGNVIAFMPFGALLPVILPFFRFLPFTAAAGLVFSACVETLQLVTMLGSFDVDDILLNTLGAFLGYLVFAVCLGIRRKWNG